jgi:hypothetical protein
LISEGTPSPYIFNQGVAIAMSRSCPMSEK